MKVSVKYFASIREAIGVASEAVETSAPTMAALRQQLLSRSDRHASALARGQVLRMALNQVMCEESAPLTDGAEVAFFPPVTGG